MSSADVAPELRKPAPVIGIDALRSVLKPDDILEVVRQALIAQARGETISPPPGQLLFQDPPGDCHVKYGMLRGSPVFVVKVAIGFYDNPKLGLPVNNGLLLVFDALTGRTVAILDDEGWLTSWRTAAAGALAALAGAPDNVQRLGVIGAGHQAELQAIWASRAFGGIPVAVWGRDPVRVSTLVQRLSSAGVNADPLVRLETLLDSCRVIISCTTATTPVIASDAIKRGTHIVALGADTGGKNEIDPALFGRAATIAVDDIHQALSHGDFGHAVRQGFVSPNNAVSLGSILASDRAFRNSDADITIADLTGLSAQDAAIAALACERLRSDISLLNSAM